MEARTLIFGLFLLGVYIGDAVSKQIDVREINKFDVIFNSSNKCQQPKAVGPCQASFPKWYYDSTLNECRRFFYGGCRGNQNRFNSEAECRGECVVSITTGLATMVTETTPAICNLPMKKGPCHAALPKWYYDNTLKQCRQFIFGGCLGNMNMFNSESECQIQCLVPLTPVEIIQ